MECVAKNVAPQQYPRPARSADFTISPSYSLEEQLKAVDYIKQVAAEFAKEGRAVMLLDPKDKMTILIIKIAGQMFDSDQLGAPQIVALNNYCRIVVE